MIWNRKVDASAREVIVELINCLIDELRVVRGSMLRQAQHECSGFTARTQRFFEKVSLLFSSEIAR